MPMKKIDIATIEAARRADVNATAGSSGKRRLDFSSVIE